MVQYYNEKGKIISQTNQSIHQERQHMITQLLHKIEKRKKHIHQTAT